MSILVRAFAWLLAAAVSFATLGPPGLRPHSDLGQDGEHALAFILVGLTFGLAYRERRLAVAAISVIPRSYTAANRPALPSTRA